LIIVIPLDFSIWWFDELQNCMALSLLLGDRSNPKKRSPALVYMAG
jgi:hypothetical protein